MVIPFTWAFHALALHAWWLASGTSGSRTSREGLLAYCQGASESLPPPLPGVRSMLLFLVSWSGCCSRQHHLHVVMESSPEPGQVSSVSAFKGCSSALKAFSF